MNIYVILHNIRSAHNVGSIFRTADGAGVRKIFLTGYTPAPTDRFGRVQEEIQKTSLGAIESVPWEQYEHIETVLEELRKNHVRIHAVEQQDTSIDYRTVQQTEDTAYIFGNEVEGVPHAVCTAADAVVHIPMHGTKESLNVSVAAGIILFHAREHSC